MGAPILAAALGIPIMGEGFKQAGKDMKQQQVKKNKYDSVLGVENVNQFKTSGMAYKEIEKRATNDRSQKDYLKVYGIPAALLAATLVRGKMTGNYMQFPKYDTVNFAGKVMPGATTTILNGLGRNPALKGNIRFAAKVGAKSNAAAASKSGGGLGSALIMGAGLTGGSVLAEYGINKAKDNDDRDRGYKKACYELGLDKTARDIPNNAKNYIRKIVREGVFQPSLMALPIYVAPAALSYGINKDIKTDFGPVRNLTEAQREKNKEKIHSSQTSFASRNNAVLNEQFSKIAHMNTKAWSKYFKNGVVKDPIKIRDWGEFAKYDLPISGLRAASITAPLALLANSDPVQKMKTQIRLDAEAKKEREIARSQQRQLRNTIKKEVQKSVVNMNG